MDARWFRLRGLMALLLACVFGTVWTAPAVALDPKDVPEPLEPWVPWVLEQRGDSVCPNIAGQPVCLWPGRLELDLDEDGGRFRLSVQLDRPGQVTLPGGEKQWPQAVEVRGKETVVMDHGGAPGVTLPAGQHTLEGRFGWSRLPETLAVPARIALLELEVGGKRVAQPRRDGERLWLKGEQAAVEEPESLTLEIFRKLDDQVPLEVTTQLVLQVSGRSRELRLPTALTPGSLPIALDAELPARIEPNGELFMQIYPGRHEIQIRALYPSPPEKLNAPRHAPPGPAQEIWVFEPHTEYRQVELRGALSIDPQRTNLPEAWRGFAAYQLEGGGELAIATLRRGEPQPPPNVLQLQRELWLDLDGQGYTVRDQLRGSIFRTWRLDLSTGELGHAAIAGQDQLITLNPQNNARGVELRQGALDLSAEWRLDDARSELPAVAWSENVEQLDAQLYLPPGWQLLNASGADSVSSTWLSRWDLFAVFFVLVIAVAVAKLDRWAWGVLALLALLAAHGEPHAPRFTWAAMLLCIALLAVLPAGRFRQLIRMVAVVASLALLGSTVSFSVSQIRAALYPQIDPSDDFHDGGLLELQRSVTMPESAPMVAQPPGSPAPMEESGADRPADADEAKLAPSLRSGAAGGALGGMGFGSIASSKADGYDVARRKQLLEQDPGAQIQTGPGVPSWRWRAWHLGWSGPVEHTHELELYLLSPGVVAWLSMLRIGLVGLLTFWALRRIWTLARRSPPGSAGGEALLVPSAAAALAFVLASLLSTPARADIPSAELLEQLKERLEPPRNCTDNCVQVPRLELEVSETEARLNAQVHVAERAAYQLPGPVSRWLPASVDVDGKAASALTLGDDGYLHVRLEPGTHRVRARGPISGRQLSLDPGTAPRWVTVDAAGWEVSGLSESGQIDGSLGLVRALAPENPASPEAESATTLPTWSRLTRTFSFGVSWTVRTVLERKSPRGSLIVARVPLLQGERVTSAGVSVEAGVAALRLIGDADAVSFDSVLDLRPELTLSAAPANSGYSERWVVACGPIFRCDAQGLAPINHSEAGRWQPTFAPWPGETLKLALLRPAAAKGQTATIDSAALTLEPGVRLLSASLDARVRTSTQTSYQLTLPEGSEVNALSINGKSEPIRQQGAKLELVLAPGKHELHVKWQAPDGLRALFRSPAVSFGAELINAEVSVQLPDERWLLAAGGPGWGPAILFWGHLALILLMAPVLAQLPRSPLNVWQWALLALGLTQVPMFVAGLVAAWFFVMAFQASRRPEHPFWFNARQFLLLAFTLVFLGCLFGAVYDSLLSTPDMEVEGSGSHQRLLHWYVDRTPGTLPEVWVLTVSLWVWRGAMLMWALWLANSLVSWLKWAWREFSSAGVWKPWRKTLDATRTP